MECAASPDPSKFVDAIASKLVPPIGSGAPSDWAEVMAGWISRRRSVRPMQSQILLGLLTLRERGQDSLSRMRILDKCVGFVPDFADLVPDSAELQLFLASRNSSFL